MLKNMLYNFLLASNLMLIVVSSNILVNGISNGTDYYQAIPDKNNFFISDGSGLTIEKRIECQRAIEQVYWHHRIWPKENKRPKPSLERIVTDDATRTKVEDILKKSNALEYYWGKPVTVKLLH